MLHQEPPPGTSTGNLHPGPAGALPSDQSVLHRHRQGVAHVQAAGHVRRRNTQAEGLVHSVRQAVLRRDGDRHAWMVKVLG